MAVKPFQLWFPNPTIKWLYGLRSNHSEKQWQRW